MQKLRKYEFDDTNAIGDLNIKFLGYNPFIFTIPWDRSNTLTLSLPISLANHLIFFSFLLKYSHVQLWSESCKAKTMAKQADDDTNFSETLRAIIICTMI